MPILFISSFSFLLFLYTVSWKCKRVYLHASIDISFYIMFYIIITIKKTLLYYIRTYDRKKVLIWACYPSHSLLFVATPLNWLHQLPFFNNDKHKCLKRLQETVSIIYFVFAQSISTRVCLKTILLSFLILSTF